MGGLIRVESCIKHGCVSDRRQFIHAAGCSGAAVNGPGSLAAETLQNVCKNGAEIFIENADELVVRAGGIQERTEDVENGSLPAFGEKFSNRYDGFERGMIERGKEKAGSNLFDTVAKFVGRQIDANA
jgi:hypothetical protein